MYDVVSVYGLAVVVSVCRFYFRNICLIVAMIYFESINVRITLMLWLHLTRDLVDT